MVALRRTNGQSSPAKIHWQRKSSGGSMRAVVTGAAGFLGSHLCDRLLAEGWEVLGLDNFITGRDENLSHLDNDEKFAFERRDVRDRLDVAGEVAYVLHFA